VKRTALILCILLSVLRPAHSYKLLYAEQFYELYHKQFYQYPENIAENIHWLERALRSDFANPLNALAVIEDRSDWERYRYLFRMHVNLLLVEQFLLWGSKYNKRDAFFYNSPFRRQNLESLEKAETLFRAALPYWEEAQRWSRRAWELQFIHLEEIQHWSDENYRIETGELDYEVIILGHLERLEAVRREFLAMDENTY
jgi:hypothetical protein